MGGMGQLHHFIGHEIYQQDDRVFISLQNYVETMPKKFNMHGCITMATPFIAN